MEGAARSAVMTKEDLPQGAVETEDRDRWRRWTKAPWTHEVGFVQARIREAFDLFDKDKKGTVVQEEVPTIIRYLGAYPTDKEIVHDLLPEMQPDEPVGFVTFDKFETCMLKLLTSDEKYEPDDDHSLRQAFLALDKERNGYINAEAMDSMMRKMGQPFRDKEVEAFMGVAKDPDTGRIYYDDYIALLSTEAEEHRDWRAKAASALRDAAGPVPPEGAAGL